jgi:cytochrome P450 family 4
MGKKLEFVSKKEEAYKTAFRRLVDIMVFRIFRPYFIPIWLYIFTPHFYREVKFVKTLHSFTTEVIVEREKDFHSDSTKRTRKRLAMLDLLLTAKREQGFIDNEGIREEVDTFMFEGHDTVSAAMIFVLMMIANHPKVQVSKFREINTNYDWFVGRNCQRDERCFGRHQEKTTIQRPPRTQLHGKVSQRSVKFTRAFTTSRANLAKT